MEGAVSDSSLPSEPQGVLRVRGGCAQRGVPVRVASGPADRADGHLLRGADTVTCLAFAYLHEVVDFVTENSLTENSL